MTVGIIGRGAFGNAVAHLIRQSDIEPECVDVGERFTKCHDIIFLVVPTQYLRAALAEHTDGYDGDTLIVNCAKGIEIDTCLLPQGIVAECTDTTRYAVMAGPSFAHEILDNIPTVVNVAVTHTNDAEVLRQILESKQFTVESLDTIVDLELSGAMKNIYALAAGYVAGSGGGENTLAHLQVVALREYTKLIHALEGDEDVVRPSVVGDLILTCKSEASRNFQYGKALAETGTAVDVTAEGASSAVTIGTLARQHNVTLPLAESVRDIIETKEGSMAALYAALGFDRL